MRRPPPSSTRPAHPFPYTTSFRSTALAAPSYRRADPQRRGIYMEDERLARLNRQGAHAVEYMSPDIHRSAERWKTKLRPGEEMVWSSSVPELKPDLQRLTDEETKDYYGFLSSQMGKPDFGQADLEDGRAHV